MRRLLLLIACAVSACSHGTYLKVELSGAPLSVDDLKVSVTDSKRTASVDIPRPRPLSLSSPQSFVLSFGDGESGTIGVDVIAWLGGAEVGHAFGSTSLDPGGSVTLTLTMSSVTDGGSSDDAAPPGTLDHFFVGLTELNAQEHQAIGVHVVALDSDGASLLRYAGSPTFSCDWGDATQVGNLTFSNGEADGYVSFNRETSAAHGPAHLIVSDGGHSGQSPDLTITAPSWSMNTSRVFEPSVGWDSYINNPTWVRVGGIYYLFYQGSNTNSPAPGIGLATSSDGMNFSRDGRTTPVVPTSPSGDWDYGQSVDKFHVQHDSTNNDFFAAYSNVNPIKTGTAHSPDGITWTRNPVALSVTDSPECGDGYNVPIAMFIDAGIRHVYFENVAEPCELQLTTESQSVATRTALSGFPVPLMETDVVQIIKEGSVYKIWYTPDSGNTTAYATSSDSVAWVPSDSGSIAFGISTVLWNEVSGGYEGLITLSNGFVRATRP